MAKRKPLGVFAKTEGEPEKTTPRGVHLSAGELARLDEIAGELGIKRHALLRYAVMYFIQQYDSGAIPIESKPTLKPL